MVSCIDGENTKQNRKSGFSIIWDLKPNSAPKIIKIIIEWWGVVLIARIILMRIWSTKTRIENEDKSTQIRINETNTQSSNSFIEDGHDYDVYGGLWVW